MVYQVLVLALCACSLIHPSQGVVSPYEYHLEAEHHAMYGRIPASAKKGDMVVAESEAVHEDEESEIIFLKLNFVPNSGQAKASTQTRPVPTIQTFKSSTQTRTEQKTTGSISASTTSDKTMSTDHITFEADGISTEDTAFVLSDEIQPESHVQILSKAFKEHQPHHHNSVHLTHSLHHHPEPAPHVINKRSLYSPSLMNTLKLAIDKSKVRRRRHVSRAIKKRFAAIDEPSHSVKINSDLSWAVHETDAFTVNAENYIIVNNATSLADHSAIEFNVYLARADGSAASNPLAFVVHIDRQEESSSYPAVPAVFAGVLVLCVVFLALFIPLVTRAKRRYKQGKPMFKLGSNPSMVDLETKSAMSRNVSEPNWYGNNAYSYEEEVAREKSDFTAGLRHMSVKSEPAKRYKEPLSEKSSSSGVDVSSQWGAEGHSGDDSYIQRL